MRRAARREAVALCLWAALALPASSQTTAFVGGGALVPTEGLADVADVGFLITGGLRRSAAGSRLSLGIEGLFGRAAHSVAGERSDLYGATGVVGYTLYEVQPLRVEMSGRLGGLVHAHKSTTFPGIQSSRSGLTLGAGLTAWGRFGGVHPFVEGAYVRGLTGLGSAAFPTRWVSVTGGLAIPFS